MKIIKRGKLIKPTKFDCDKCECVFEAGTSEYEQELYLVKRENGTEKRLEMSTRCPNCNFECTVCALMD